MSRAISWNTTAGDIVLDMFAGSGSTAHAAMYMPGGQRKFILVEMGDYFDTVLVPRIKKVMSTPEWKDGRPKRPATKEKAAALGQFEEKRINADSAAKGFFSLDGLFKRLMAGEA